jgi:hypothetical protein
VIIDNLIAPPIKPISEGPGFPPWYEGGFVDIEWLLMDYFGGLLSGVTCLTWLPPEKEALEQIQLGTIYLRIFRSGGRIVRGEANEGSVDRAHVQFATYSASRDLSWEVIEFVRQVLYCFDRGGSRMQTASQYAVITCNGEIVGPALVPEAFRDPRLVPVTFELESQRRKGLPSFDKYGADLGL